MDTDYYFFSADITRQSAAALISVVRARKTKKSRAILFLVTNGGDPDAAYSMARCMQRHYPVFNVAIPTACKSAGTLIAIGATSIILADGGELGPLDVQLQRDNELAGQISTLVAGHALNAVQARAFSSFEQAFISILTKSGGRLNTKTAADIAVDLTKGLFQPVMEQLDPMRIGEHDRSINIAMEYGTRLNQKFANLRDDSSLPRLIYMYPSHGFVIDCTEAAELFHRVLPFDAALEKVLSNCIKSIEKNGTTIFAHDEVDNAGGESNERATEEAQHATRLAEQAITRSNPETGGGGEVQPAAPAANDPPAGETRERNSVI